MVSFLIFFVIIEKFFLYFFVFVVLIVVFNVSRLVWLVMLLIIFKIFVMFWDFVLSFFIIVFVFWMDWLIVFIWLIVCFISFFLLFVVLEDWIDDFVIVEEVWVIFEILMFIWERWFEFVFSFLFCVLLLFENCLMVSVICLVVLFVWVVFVVNFLEDEVMFFIDVWIILIIECNEVDILLKFLLSCLNLFFEWILMIFVRFLLLIFVDVEISFFNGLVMVLIIKRISMLLMISDMYRMIIVVFRIGFEVFCNLLIKYVFVIF